ncbi:MAG: dTDP-4-dehydrorhamnose reductase [Treponema sp.]|jgi:dTDP-4-dehydrorhamnose reductase|nr:dTDP-4-dehydrorhamnose reductase [Treponema sp.]
MVWLIGNKGMLGTELSLLFVERGLDFAVSDREIDITDPVVLENFANSKLAQGKRINWVVNCAGYTDVDRAEDDVETCRRLNVDGPGYIASLAYKLHARFIHVSTDYVFGKYSKVSAFGNGEKWPYLEADATNPLGVYATSKRDGEVRVMENTPGAYVMRTSWLYGKYGKNFVTTMLRLMRERDTISVVNDQRGTPTWTYDMADAIFKMIDSIEHPRWDALPPINVPFFGIYHYTNEGDTTWFDFACAIYEKGRKLGLLAKDCEVKPCSSAEYPSKVQRPDYSVLCKDRIRNEISMIIPAWEESLEQFLKELKRCGY